MADVRINGKRIPPLQSIDKMSSLIVKLENLANNSNSALTSLNVNDLAIDIDNIEFHKIQLENDDKVEAKFDTPQQLSFESLQVALDMSELLLFDLKVAALKIWDNDSNYEKTLQILLEDCNLFLTLAAKPIYLLNKNPTNLEIEAQNCLQELDRIANHLENATLLALNHKNKEACFVLVGIVQSSIERWSGLSAIFAQSLNINNQTIVTPLDQKQNKEIQP